MHRYTRRHPPALVSYTMLVLRTVGVKAKLPSLHSSSYVSDVTAGAGVIVSNVILQRNCEHRCRLCPRSMQDAKCDVSAGKTSALYPKGQHNAEPMSISLPRRHKNKIQNCCNFCFILCIICVFRVYSELIIYLSLSFFISFFHETNWLRSRKRNGGRYRKTISLDNLGGGLSFNSVRLSAKMVVNCCPHGDILKRFTSFIRTRFNPYPATR